LFICFRRTECSTIAKIGTPSSHWFSNILQDLWSHSIERDMDLTADLALYVVGNTDASWLGDPFKAGGDIYAVPEDIVVVDDYVAEVNAMRNSILISFGTSVFCAAMPRWTSTAQRAASTALANSTQHAVAR
jgi:hypothetical protein